MPARRFDQRDICQLSMRSVRLASVRHNGPIVSDLLGNQVGQLEDTQIFTHADVDPIRRIVDLQQMHQGIR